ncbi:MAG: hypothetical protein JW793_12855 [Acidobacteria bacterium]|nr:hypothetical protein [Acidobacteriota bacterium]
MLIVFLLLNVLVVLLCIVLRYSPAVFPYAVPFPISPDAAGWLAGLTVVVAAYAVHRIWKRPEIRRPLAELLLIFPPLFWLIWMRIPPDPSRPVEWAPFGTLFAALFILFYADRNNRRLWGINRQEFRRAARYLAFPTLIMALAPVVAAVFVGTELQPANAVVGFLTYPLYAFAQLLLFLVFPVRRFRQITGSRTEAVMALAGLFALLHWPNGITMLCGFIAMAVWALAYLRHPNLYAVALSMGFAAVLYTQVLPDRLTNHVRVGPNYVYTRMASARPQERWKAAGRLVRLSGSPESDSGRDEEFVMKMYDGLLDRAPAPDRLNFWVKIASEFGRPNTLHSFLRSSDFKPRGFREWRPPLTSSLDFQGSLDELKLGDAGIHLSGWAADVKTGELPESIAVFVNGERAESERFLVPRMDVADFFGLPSLERAGFLIKVSTGNFPPASPCEVRLFAVSRDRIPMELGYIGTHKFTLPNSD